MSKTYKTNPWWVGQWWEPVHGLYCPEYMPRRRGQQVDRYRACDLPAEPPQRIGTDRWPRPGMKAGCTWWPDSPNPYGKSGRKLFGRGRYVQLAANLRERGIRTAWRDCAKTLLSLPIGEIEDVVLPDPRHRHSALWNWDW